MAIGFDFGTANCSVAHIVNDDVHAIPLVGEQCYIPSTLCAPTREAVSEYLFRCLNIAPSNETGEIVLRRAINLNRDEGLDINADDIQFGQAALMQYLDDPKFTYYVKSPKSFLGTTGLRDVQMSFFEDLVCAMMANIKQRVETVLDKPVTETVIGRPVNFHGRGGMESNRQALRILHNAAKRAGFKHIEFQYEPVAAGLEYESTLTSDQNVLVVDIGGGTSDCSLIRMGPGWSGKSERTETLLSHTGLAVGGNDLDISIAFKRFMPEFGMGTQQLSGLPLPIPQFWNGIAINDVESQRNFYSLDNLLLLKKLHKEVSQPDKLARLILMHQGTLGHSVVREAEKTKIALADKENYMAKLDLLAEQIDVPVFYEQMEEAIIEPTRKIRELVQETLKQGGVTPDVVYMTGGSARSPILRKAVNTVLPDTKVVSGDYFGSVTAGLARWAKLCFS